MKRRIFLKNISAGILASQLPFSTFSGCSSADNSFRNWAWTEAGKDNCGFYPGNKAIGKSVLNSSVILNSAETGEPLALLDGGTLTALRTGAVGGMGVKYITSESVKTLGLAGAGVQGIQQVLFAMSQRNFQTILVSDPDEDRVTELKKIMKRYFPQTVVEKVQNPDEFLSRAVLIIYLLIRSML